MKLSRIYLARDQTPVFQGLSLSLDERRIGLIGANGSGKSSLLRLIKGLVAPDSGEVHRSDSVGIVFQNPEHQLLFPTVMEELCFGMLEKGVPKSEAEISARGLLARYQQEALADQAVHELSDGQKQMVCIFSVLADGVNAILMDEPCSSLDHRSTRQVMGIIGQLPQQVIMATHHLELLEQFDRVLWLDRGKILGDGEPQSVIANYRTAMEP